MNSLSRERNIFVCRQSDICLACILQKKITLEDGITRSLILSGDQPLNENRQSGQRSTSGILRSSQRALQYSWMLQMLIMKVRFFSTTYCTLSVETMMQKE